MSVCIAELSKLLTENDCSHLVGKKSRLKEQPVYVNVWFMIKYRLNYFDNLN